MSLADLCRGQTATVAQIADESTRVQLLRFGVTSGSRIQCCARLPLGPVVFRFCGQEIAVGRQIAREIPVLPEGSQPACRARLIEGGVQ